MKECSRKSMRLKGYDYTMEGLYFITLCVKNRQCLLGTITEERMILSEAGKIAYEEWLKTPLVRPETVILHEFVIMPDHFHAIVEIRTIGHTLPTHLGNIVKGYKASVSKRLGYSIWQRGYYDHIIRDTGAYQDITQYIRNNIAQWDARENELRSI